MNTHTSSDLLDVIIVGAGPAGLSAALLLGRSLKQVLVIDSGKPRNAVSHAANGFFSRDGIAPSELLKIGREQLHKYENVQFQTGKVIDAKPLGTASEEGDRFQITLDSDEQLITRKLLLATGVTDSDGAYRFCRLSLRLSHGANAHAGRWWRLSPVFATGKSAAVDVTRTAQRLL